MCIFTVPLFNINSYSNIKPNTQSTPVIIEVGSLYIHNKTSRIVLCTEGMKDLGGGKTGFSGIIVWEEEDENNGSNLGWHATRWNPEGFSYFKGTVTLEQ